jgi:hypothetical protein
MSHEPQYVTILGKRCLAYVIDGELVSVIEMGLRSGCSRRTIVKRIESGMTPREAMETKTNAREPPPIRSAFDAGLEPVDMACDRLKAEGRYKPFLKLRNLYDNLEFGLSSEQAFYEALRFFPPLAPEDRKRIESARKRGGKDVARTRTPPLPGVSDAEVKAGEAVPGPVSGVSGIGDDARRLPEGGGQADQTGDPELGSQ